MRVKPRSSRSDIQGPRGGELSVRLTSPPVDGAANAELCGLLADRLGVPKSHVRLERGASGRSKTLVVGGVDVATARSALG